MDIKIGRGVIIVFGSDWNDEYGQYKQQIGLNFNSSLALSSAIWIYLLPL
jgi:hypothetical protein